MTIADLQERAPQDWDKLTKAKLKELRFQGETITERTMTRDAQTGGLGVLTEVCRDLLTNAVVSRRVTWWTYFPTGEIDEIAVTEFDAQDKETKRPTIKHYGEGRLPQLVLDNDD